MRLLFNVEACVPSRAALMTGRYQFALVTGAFLFYANLWANQWETTLAEILSNSGYQTAAFGKWHLGHADGRYPTTRV